MQKHLRLVSGLSAMMALIAVAGSPAHAEWVNRDEGALEMSMNTTPTQAQIFADDTTGRRYVPSPVAQGKIDIYYEWVPEPDAPTPRAAKYKVTHYVHISGTVTPHIDLGATGSGSSIANITVNGNSYTGAEYSNPYGNITSAPATIPPNSSQSDIFTVYTKTNKPTLHLTFTGSLSAYSEEQSMGTSRDVITPGGEDGGPPVGGTTPSTVHNLAPGTAQTSAASAKTNAIFTVAQP